MKIKTYIEDLKVGMYVSELDRPWLDTPFKFQGFFITREEDIGVIRRFCEYVYVDPDKKDTDPDRPRLHIGNFSTGYIKRFIPKPKHYEISIPVEEEIAQAQKSRSRTRKFIDSLMEDTRLGKSLDLDEARAIVSEMVDSVIRNPNAQMCLTQLKNRDEYTAQHSVNVCVLTITFGRHLGLNRKALNLAGLGALLHDIGKLRVPLEVLNKPDRLTEEEYREIRNHPNYGLEVLSVYKNIPREVLDVVSGHHERLAGHGYPNGLQHGEISFYARMVAIVDVYDAITSDRCYHDGMKPTEALTQMYNWRERDFDIELMEQFIQCIGIYPIGSIVELTTGEVGIVISLNPGIRLRPKLMLVRDAEKKPYYPPRILDLSSTPTEDEHVIAIRSVLESGTYNIDPRDYIRELQQAQLKN